MRRFVFPILVASGLVLIGAGSAHAEPTPAAGATSAVPPKKACKITDPKLDELSGLVATADGYITVNDGSQTASHKRIFFLDSACKIANQVKFSGDGPFDTEAMALAPDGKTLWIGDIGDNNRERATIALWKMTVDSPKEPVLYRLHYPSNAAHDAEGLIINGDGTPVIVTKDPGTAQLYTPEGPLKTGTSEGVALKKAGEIKLPATTTENPFGPVGRLVATDAAVSPDRSKVVVRTYADAFEWPVSGGDVLAAFKGTPAITPLPNEPQGESIAYSPDGKVFLTVSDMQGKPQSADNYILRYTPVAQAGGTKSAATAGGTVASDAGKSVAWYNKLSLDDITYLVGSVGLIGAILVGFGIFGIVRSRRQSPLGPADLDDGSSPSGPKPTDARTELLSVGGPQRPGVYGGAPARSAPAGVYGRPPGPAPAAGGPGAGRPGTGRPGTGGPGAGGPGAGGSGAGGTGSGGSQRGGGVYGGAPSVGRPTTPPGPNVRPVPPPNGRPPVAPGRPGAGQPRTGQGGQPGPGQGGPTRPGHDGPGGQGGPRPGPGGLPGRGGVHEGPPAPPSGGQSGPPRGGNAYPAPPPGRNGGGQGPSSRPPGFFSPASGAPQADGGRAQYQRGYDAGPDPYHR